MTGRTHQPPDQWRLDVGPAANHVPATVPTPFVLACEHAGRAIPAGMDNLGMAQNLANSHNAWDPGAFDLAKLLAEELPADLVWQRYSRLVYDCNRPPTSPASILEQAEDAPVPGNTDISDTQRQWRIDNIYRPFQSRLRKVLAAKATPVLVTVHSFTPVYRGTQRDVELGILHDEDPRLADVMLKDTQLSGAFDTRRNEPYAAKDGVTHTLIEQALLHHHLNVMIEVRNDLLDTANKRQTVAKALATALKNAVKSLAETHADLSERTS